VPVPLLDNCISARAACSVHGIGAAARAGLPRFVFGSQNGCRDGDPGNFHGAGPCGSRRRGPERWSVTRTTARTSEPEISSVVGRRACAHRVLKSQGRIPYNPGLKYETNVRNFRLSSLVRRNDACLLRAGQNAKCEVKFYDVVGSSQSNDCLRRVRLPGLQFSNCRSDRDHWSLKPCLADLRPQHHCNHPSKLGSRNLQSTVPAEAV
jgi:hypothetical protein